MSLCGKINNRYKDVLEQSKSYQDIQIDGKPLELAIRDMFPKWRPKGSWSELYEAPIDLVVLRESNAVVLLVEGVQRTYPGLGPVVQRSRIVAYRDNKEDHSISEYWQYFSEESGLAPNPIYRGICGVRANPTNLDVSVLDAAAETKHFTIPLAKQWTHQEVQTLIAEHDAYKALVCEEMQKFSHMAQQLQSTLSIGSNYNRGDQYEN